jgi:DNA modification methylase
MTTVLARPGVVLLNCDARSLPLPDESVQCVVTSPPYWGLRDYGTPGQLGLCKTPEEYVANMTDVFREVRRVLKDDGVLWLNLGDSYIGGGRAGKDGKSYPSGLDGNRINSGCVHAPPTGKVEGLKTKDLVGIPWRVAFALQADGWYLRSDIIWSKPNPMPESVTDRPTKAHEYIFLMSKSAKYYYDADAVKEKAVSSYKSSDFIPKSKKDALGVSSAAKASANNRTDEVKNETKNRRSVWLIATQPYKEAHFATFPEVLPRLCISAGSRLGDVVLDPFGGSGTTGKVALELGRKIVHVDIGYHDLAIKRMGLNAS